VHTSPSTSAAFTTLPNMTDLSRNGSGALQASTPRPTAWRPSAVLPKAQSAISGPSAPSLEGDDDDDETGKDVGKQHSRSVLALLAVPPQGIEPS
jgi:hypothetical protein